MTFELPPKLLLVTFYGIPGIRNNIKWKWQKLAASQTSCSVSFSLKKKCQSIIFCFEKYCNWLISNNINKVRLLGNHAEKSHQSLIKASFYRFFTKYFMPSLNLSVVLVLTSSCFLWLLCTIVIFIAV